MNDLDTIQKQNGTTPEEAREAAKPFYYRPKVRSLDIDKVCPVDISDGVVVTTK